MKQLLTVLSVLFSLTLSAQTVRVSYDESSQSIVFGNNRYKMIHVSGGSFLMGATSEQGGAAKSQERPAHRVTVSGFYIGQTEVTQALWEAIMGNNPSHFRGDDRPVEKVSWDDCQTFIRKLNSITGRRFRLPTEAEWEFAARGGNKSQRYMYSGNNSIYKVAWTGALIGKDAHTHPVGQKQANELGIYDMSGNVYEWCSDWYGDYGSYAQTNPAGPNNGSRRVARGGSWHSQIGYEGHCRVSSRSFCAPSNRLDDLGLRLVLIP